LLNKVDEEMLDYNVFVLDADEEKMRHTIGHLMMHSCGSGVPGVERPQPTLSASPSSQGDEVHTVGVDGGASDQVERGEDVKMNSRSSEAGSEMDLVVGDIDIEVDTRIDSDGDINMGERSSSPSRRQEMDNAITDDEPLRNTVDFALREREEMRDLTKATEILSLFPSSGSTNSTPTKATFTKSGLHDSPSGTPLDVSPSVQPPHLQHLSNILSPRSTSFSQNSLSSPAVEYTYNHPDPTVDVTSPATFFDPRVGQVFLGNSGDVPLLAEQPITSIENARARLEDPEADESAPDDPFNYAATNAPSKGLGYDICIECHELAPFPTPAHLRAAEEHLVTLERVWRDRTIRKEMQNIKAGLEPGPEGASTENMKARVETKKLNIPPRPPPHANAIIHIPFPSSPPNSQATLAQLIPVMRFLEKWVKPVGDVHVDVEIEIVPRPKESPSEEPAQESSSETGSTSHVRRWSNSVVASILPSVFGSSSSISSTGAPPRSPSPPPSSSRSRSNTTPASGSNFNPFQQHGTQNSQNPYSPSYSSSYQPPRHQPPAPQRFAPTRPLKILIYSADGYTESSLPSLCLLMSVKGLSLPEAYLELQVGVIMPAQTRKVPLLMLCSGRQASLFLRVPA
jgi:dual specificity MAP kinase phosphatase